MKIFEEEYNNDQIDNNILIKLNEQFDNGNRIEFFKLFEELLKNCE